ncbi:TonB-dependent receptor domain-containing protein [Erythrobacter sp.]|uniref:TonB-dependent receptor domain-containing protein n=1 Tax=Erythrobacter sp. TaxID=1042 RepID=UPI002EA950ED|nr:TonB-dependent receptor [Erythrobacter sp.]
MAVGIALAASPAFAQDAEVVEVTTVEDEGEVNAIVVTGTRLNVNPNLRSVSPVLAVSSEEIAVRGVVDIEDLTNALPQVFAAQTADQSNGATGTSQLDLRNLGPQRTLTLIDGRRLPYGDSASIAVNLDLVPTNLVERIDVLTGGSSAVYGSDAVSGVVNFVLRDDFEGVELDVQYGFAQSDNGRTTFEEVLAAAQQPIPGSVTDGEEISASVIFGANMADGRGNVTGFFGYQNRNEILQRDRTASACALGASTGANSANGFGCIGSSNFRRYNNVADFANTDVFLNEDGQFVPFVGGPAQTFNFGPQNFFQRPAERFQFYTKATYEVADGHELFGDLAYVDNVSDAQIAPSASFGFFQRSINCDNPLLQGDNVTNAAGDTGSFAEIVLQCSEDQIETGLNEDGTPAIIDGITSTYRNVEGGGRNSRLENRAFRAVGGIRGTFGEFFDYEAFGQYAATRDEDTSTNDFRIDRLGQALLVTTDDDGNPVCIDPSNGCVPYNIFQRSADGQSLVTQEALDFIQGVGITTGETEQLVVGATVQTDLANFGLLSPLADDVGVGFLVGTEYRKDSLDATPDEISQQPDGGFTGVGGPTLPVSGEVEVFELFGEIQVPLITNRPFFDELVFSAQYRYSDYTVDGNDVQNSFSTDTYGFQLAWAPIRDISFRGQFQRAVRAPNVVELFTGQSTGLPDLAQAGTDAQGNGVFDPCSGTVPIASAAACANTGVTAAQFGSVPDVISGQTQGVFGGNPELDPESSDTITAGVVFQPTFFPGFSASVDYFKIEIEDAIVAGLGAQVILDNCLATGNETFCDLINRDAAGSLNASGPDIGFTLTNVNAAALESEGFDAQVNYNYDIGSFGGLNFNYAGTYLLAQDFQPFPGADVVECEGEFAGQCGLPTSQYRHRLITSWETPLEGLQANIVWRHQSGVDNDSASPAPVELELNAVNYVDLSVQWEFLDGITGRAGVNNVFEENFPVSVSAGPANNGNGNTYPGIYDTGRFFFVGLNVAL